MDNKGIGKYELSAIALFSLKNSLGLVNLTLRLDKHLLNELGVLSLGSTTTVKKVSQERRVFHAS